MDLMMLPSGRMNAANTLTMISPAAVTTRAE
jgi:hypothetical protein